tara:strand:- start:232 stop:417 length:186 start_codon:yes stop_codon:yes gene_type:complete
MNIITINNKSKNKEIIINDDDLKLIIRSLNNYNYLDDDKKEIQYKSKYGSYKLDLHLIKAI